MIERQHCICGDALWVETQTKTVLEKAVDLFWEIHSGEGHGPCEAITAVEGLRKRQQEAIDIKP